MRFDLRIFHVRRLWLQWPRQREPGLREPGLPPASSMAQIGRSGSVIGREHLSHLLLPVVALLQRSHNYVVHAAVPFVGQLSVTCTEYAIVSSFDVDHKAICVYCYGNTVLHECCRKLHCHPRPPARYATDDKPCSSFCVYTISLTCVLNCTSQTLVYT